MVIDLSFIKFWCEIILLILNQIRTARSFKSKHMTQIKIFISPSSLFCLMKSLIDGHFVCHFFNSFDRLISGRFVVFRFC